MGDARANGRERRMERRHGGEARDQMLAPIRRDPLRASGHILEDPAQGRDLHGQIALLDREIGPGSIDQGLLGNRRARMLKKQPQQRDLPALLAAGALWPQARRAWAVSGVLLRLCLSMCATFPVFQPACARKI